MATIKRTNPYAVKGFTTTSPKGTAKWCKVVEPERTFNAKGTYATDLVCNPKEPAVQEFIARLEALRDTAFDETKETLGEVKAKGLKKREVYQEEADANGNATGNIIFKFKMNNVDDRERPNNKIEVVDAHRNLMRQIPLVGNGSVIRCVAYANPYFMASTKDIGVSLMWSKMQLIELVSFGSGGSDFDDEDGFVSTDRNGFSDESDVEEDELDF